MDPGHDVMTSVGYLIFVIPTSSRDLKKNSESKNRLFWVFGKIIQKQRTASFGYFRNFKKTAGFHDRTGKDLALQGGYFIFSKN
jgi:hypothetical protein